MSSYWSLYYHFVWGTKNRLPLIDKIREDLLQFSFRSTCKKHGILVHAVGFMPEHVHLVLSISPNETIRDTAQWLKGASSHYVNRNDSRATLGTFAWQHEYGVFSFSERSLDLVVGYAENQKARHAQNGLIPIYEQLGHVPPRSAPSELRLDSPEL